MNEERFKDPGLPEGEFETRDFRENTDIGDPFVDPRDHEMYWKCGYAVHDHYVPVLFDTCRHEGAWVWEEKYPGEEKPGGS